jgi:hypothetical protein
MISVSYNGAAKQLRYYEGQFNRDEHSHIVQHEEGRWFLASTRSAMASVGHISCCELPAEDLDRLEAAIAQGFAGLPKRELTNTKIRVRACIRKLRPLLVDLVRRGETLDSLEQELAVMCKEVLVEAVQDV